MPSSGTSKKLGVGEDVGVMVKVLIDGLRKFSDEDY